MSLKQLCFSLRGRICRSQYWNAIIPVLITQLIMAVTIESFPIFLWLLMYLPLVYVDFALAVKRVHDINMSAWFVVLLVGLRSIDIPVVYISGWIGTLYFCGIRRSYALDNQYGSPPQLFKSESV